MHRLIIVTVLTFSTYFAGTAAGVIAPGSADSTTADGWQPVGFPGDDYFPWSLSFDAKNIAEADGKFLVISGYLVASPDSLILYPSEGASRSGRTDGALILAREDSPALRWLFSRRKSEGIYAVGGVFSRSTKGHLLGHLTKVRFAMKSEPGPTLK